jgi:hypothetical protein
MTADAFGHAVGLLMLRHTGRIRLFRTDARALMEGYLEALIERGPQPAR